MSAPSPPSRRSVPVRIRLARLGDVGPLSKLYVGLSPASRRGYHPFRFYRPTVVLTYSALVIHQRLMGWAMRRFPRLLALLLVAEVEGAGTLCGSGTLRGLVRPGEEPRVRFGFFVADGYQGAGVGKRILWGLAAAGLERGYRRGIGAVFQSDLKALQAIGGAGFRFRPTEYRDPVVPDEVNYEADADLAEMVRLSQGGAGAPPPAAERATAPPPTGTPGDGGPSA